MFELKGKSALVTGATSGIGKAIVFALHKQGANVAGVGRREENLVEIKNQLKERFIPLCCDLTNANSLAELPKKASESMGEISILVNAAGMTKDSLLMRQKDENWEEVLLLNLTAVMKLSRDILRKMILKRWGRIINISSVVASSGSVGQTNYAATKAGLEGLTRSLSLEVANRNITVNSVAPGMITTAMTDSLSEKAKETIISQIPIGRPGSADEVAFVVAFLASEEASYITGTTLHVNGGAYLS